MDEVTSPESVATEEKPFSSQPIADQQEHVPATAERPSVAPDIEQSEGDKNGKIVLRENDCYGELGYKFSTLKKWYIITMVFWVQVFMNFNASIYNNGADGMAKDFGVSDQAVKVGASVFLIMYAFGCELWAPWSEEFGRKPVLQASMTLVNLFQLPVALAPNLGVVIAGRALGGLSTAGGSVTLGMVADLWEPENQQYAVAYVVFSSVAGSILGPIFGGFLTKYAEWRWCIWTQLILGGLVQVIHLFTVPETRTTIMMDKIAKRRRKESRQTTGETMNIWGPNEVCPFKDRFSAKEILVTWVRPFRMFLTEPIVLVLSLLSGFADALIFMFIHSFGIVYKEIWKFGPIAIGLAFLPILVSYFLAWGLFIPAFRRNHKARQRHPGCERTQYESRLWMLLWTAPCLPVGLLGFALVVRYDVHWIASMIFAALVGISNYAIYMATIDYMICAYGPYSASATGGNGWARDILAGVLVLPSKPFFTNIGKKGPESFRNASLVLCAISVPLVASVYWIYWMGPVMRKKSPFAQELAVEREEAIAESRRPSLASSPYASRRNSVELAPLTPEDRPAAQRRKSARSIA